MTPAKTDYAAPTTLAEACRLLAATPGAKVLAGGMSLIPAMKTRFSQPPLLVDIGRIAELSGVSTSGENLRIGARTVHAELIGHPELEEFPVFSETASVIGDPQVRNRGTLGGSLAFAHPSADWPAVFLMLEGEAKLVSAGANRTVKATDFFVSILTSTVAEDEVLTELVIPFERKRTGGTYCKLRHQATGYAVVGVAAQLTLDRKGRIAKATIGITGVNAVPFRAYSVESFLAGARPDRDLFERLSGDIPEVDPMADRLTPPDYRRQLLKIQAVKALEIATARALRRPGAEREAAYRFSPPLNDT